MRQRGATARIEVALLLFIGVLGDLLWQRDMTQCMAAGRRRHPRSDTIVDWIGRAAVLPS